MVPGFLQQEARSRVIETKQNALALVSKLEVIPPEEKKPAILIEELEFLWVEITEITRTVSSMDKETWHEFLAIASKLIHTDDNVEVKRPWNDTRFIPPPEIISLLQQNCSSEQWSDIQQRAIKALRYGHAFSWGHWCRGAKIREEDAVVLNPYVHLFSERFIPSSLKMRASGTGRLLTEFFQGAFIAIPTPYSDGPVFNKDRSDFFSQNFDVLFPKNEWPGEKILAALVVAWMETQSILPTGRKFDVNAILYRRHEYIAHDPYAVGNCHQFQDEVLMYSFFGQEGIEFLHFAKQAFSNDHEFLRVSLCGWMSQQDHPLRKAVSHDSSQRAALECIQINSNAGFCL